jgi:ATP-dependent Clp protease adaptor protein ClpS
MMDPMAPQTVIEPTTDEKTKLIPMVRVLIHNDDVTPMGFVLHVLGEVFKLDFSRAHAVMMEAHETGVALVVVEPFERAELHVDQTRSLARPRGFPLTFSIEPEA